MPDEDRVALFSFAPRSCPDCSRPFKLDDHFQKQDFFSGASHSCPGCGLHFAYAAPKDLVELAGKAGGDMPRYVKL